MSPEQKEATPGGGRGSGGEGQTLQLTSAVYGLTGASSRVSLSSFTQTRGAARLARVSVSPPPLPKDGWWWVSSTFVGGLESGKGVLMWTPAHTCIPSTKKGQYKKFGYKPAGPKDKTRELGIKGRRRLFISFLPVVWSVRGREVWTDVWVRGGT